MKIVTLNKLIARIFELFVIIGSIAITTVSLNYANEIRGHVAYGGEYLLPLLGLLIVMGIETLLDTQEAIHGQIK